MEAKASGGKGKREKQAIESKNEWRVRSDRHQRPSKGL